MAHLAELVDALVLGTSGIGGLGWSHWYTGRASCRRLGGDLPSERQWEGIASGGYGGYAQGPRPNPWGATGPSAASVQYRGGLRSGSAWLGVTPEGLADLTAHAISNGEWTLADDADRPSGENPQSGPTAGHHRATWKGGGTGRRSDFPVRARYYFYNYFYLFRNSDLNGSSRCVWGFSRP